MEPPDKCRKCEQVVADLFMVCEGGCGWRYHRECAGVIGEYYEGWIKCQNLRFICDNCFKTNTSVNTKLELLEQFIYKIDQTTQKQTQMFSTMECEFRAIKDMLKNIQTKSNECNKMEIDDVELRPKSYSDALKRQTLTKRGRSKSEPDETIQITKRQAIKPALIIRPKKVQDPKKIKEDIKSKIDPSKVKVVATKNVSSGGIVLESKNAETLEKLKKVAEDNLGVDYTVDYAKLRTPEFKILHLRNEIDGQELIQKIKFQNDLIAVGDLSFIKMEKRMNKFTQKESFNAVFGASEELYKEILSIGKLSIGWQSCKVVENINVRICYKCRDFNHTAINCQNKLACSKCGDEHDLKDCNAETTNCINCVRSNQKFNLKVDINHPSWSRTCPTYMEKFRRMSSVSINA